MVDAGPETRIEPETTMMNRGSKTLMLGSMNTMMIKKTLTVVTMIVAMAATALADTNYDGGPSGTGTNWNTAANWDTDLVPINPAVVGGHTIIDGAYDVVINSAPPSPDGELRVQGGASLTINASIKPGDDLFVSLNGAGGTVNMNAGLLDLGSRKVKLFAGGSTFNMMGGTVEVGDKFEMYSGSLLEISGGSFNANDTDGVEFGGGTIRVVGDGASLIYFTQVISGGGTYEFVPTAAGGITTITSSNEAGKAIRGAGISVDLDNLTVATATMTLFEGAPLDTMSVTVTKDGSTLVEGDDYTLDYLGGTGLVLSVNVAPTGTVIMIR